MLFENNSIYNEFQIISKQIWIDNVVNDFNWSPAKFSKDKRITYHFAFIDKWTHIAQHGKESGKEAKCSKC